MPELRKFTRDYYFKCIGLPRNSHTVMVYPKLLMSNQYGIIYVAYKLHFVSLISGLFTEVIYKQRYAKELRIPHICGIYVNILRWLLTGTIQPSLLHFELLFRGEIYSGVGFKCDDLNACLNS